MRQSTARREQGEALVRVRGLRKYFRRRRSLFGGSPRPVKAVDGLDLDIHKGETLGLIGESGSGKSTAGRCLLHLLEPDAGSVEFDSQPLSRLGPRNLRLLRRRMQMIFQDPYASLNPRLTVGRIVSEPLEIHGLGSRREREQRVHELLAQVGLSPDFVSRYPHEFSGGQRQRIGIARALATKPSFIVADEPISALDVSIQAQVVNLLSDLKEDLGLTYLLIAHDLSMVRHLCDRVAVMYLGRIVEVGRCNDVFSKPLHPYTQALIESIPIPNPTHRAQRPSLLTSSELPDPTDPPAGCRFHPRCPRSTDLCRTADPPLLSLESNDQDHLAACHHAGQRLAFGD